MTPPRFWGCVTVRCDTYFGDFSKILLKPLDRYGQLWDSKYIGPGGQWDATP